MKGERTTELFSFFLRSREMKYPKDIQEEKIFNPSMEMVSEVIS